MLTDHASQFETKSINEIPKSFQKLINEIQNVKKKKKQSKNSSLDVKTIQKNPKIPAIKKKKNPKKPKPLDDLEQNDDESDVSKTSGIQILNQTNITEFFNSVKKNLSNCYAGKNLEETKKCDEFPNVNDEILSSDDDQLFYSHQNRNRDVNKLDFPVSEFQNPDYLNYLSSRNNDFNPINERDGFNIAECSENHQGIQTGEDDNWKTFNEINTDMDYDFDIERRKNIAPSTFYSCNSSNLKPNSKVAEKINQPDILLAKNLDNDITIISHKNGPKDKIQHNGKNRISHRNGPKALANDWLAMLKDDQEKMSNLLNQVKSMNDIITKSKQDISKFFMYRNN